MKQITCQFDGQRLTPFGENDLHELDQEYKRNQLVTCRTTRIGKGMEPSILQHGLLFACFKLVADNRDYRSLEHAKEACKVAIDFRDLGIVIVRPDGGVQFRYRSYSFKTLFGKERDQVMEKSFQWCADELGLTVEQLVEEAKLRMGRN